MTTQSQHDLHGRSHPAVNDGLCAAAAQAALRLTDPAPHGQEPWSAHHLPEPAAPRSLRYSTLAVAVGLTVAIVASAMWTPIRTTGTRMEPARFQTPAGQAALSPADRGITVAAAAR
jgi:hypothetical protein